MAYFNKYDEFCQNELQILIKKSRAYDVSLIFVNIYV